MENAMTTAQLPPQVPTLVIKVGCGDDIRKFKYPMSGGDLMDLKGRVLRLYQIASPDQLLLKYKDGDNDWITLSDDDDLRLAIELEKGAALYVKVVRPFAHTSLVENPSVVGREVVKMGEQMSKISFAPQPQQPPSVSSFSSSSNPLMPSAPPSYSPAGYSSGQMPQVPLSQPVYQQQPQMPTPPQIPSYPQANAQQQQQQVPPQYQRPTIPSYPPSGHY